MAPALNNLLGGQVDGFFADVPAVMAQIKGGRVKALGMASKTRHPLLPEVKTFEEQGFKSWIPTIGTGCSPQPKHRLR
jgi:tripartite-type tricarboxylate transporter receptor subunit TctC